MFAALRAGSLDAALERAIGPLSEVPAKGPASRRPESVRPAHPREQNSPRRGPPQNPALQGVSPSVSPPTSDDFDAGTLRDLPPASLSQPAPRSRKTNQPPRRSRPPSPHRPAAQFAGAPEARARSIFGDEAISEQTLDEVILSYLAEDLDDSGE